MPAPDASEGADQTQEPARKRRRRPPEPLPREDVLALLGAANRGATGDRARALIVVLWRCGLRLGEALALETKDVDLERGTLRVRHGKGDLDRWAALDTEARDVLRRWLDRRAELAIDPLAPIFCTVTGAHHRRDKAVEPGRPLSQQWARGLLKRLAKAAGIARRVHPHGLRHTFAQELALESHPLLVIQQALGHRHPSTTSTYLHRIAPEALLDALRNRPAWSAGDRY